MTEETPSREKATEPRHPMEQYLAEQAAKPGPTMTITKAAYVFLLEQLRAAEAAHGAAPLDLTAGATAIIDDVAARIGPNFDGHLSEGAAPRAEGLQCNRFRHDEHCTHD